MPIVTVYHRIDFSGFPDADVGAFFTDVRQVLADELQGDAPGHALSPDSDFELYLQRVGDRPGEHVTWDISIDIEAYDFDYRIERAEALAASIMNRASELYSRRFGQQGKFAVWLKLLTAAWVQSRH
ncbi:MAG: hypothetical protein IJO71_08350 [Microbacterium sp.]|jgi:hypothetical protein|uniref:hypothetical protein n=1 Tax=Microbacterium sp. TaxID=51671 RepID=UPI0025FC987A|nr:hypothetical protein [Microbacterium sp.]MBQ9917196.1 hypothetical protein [Microbacterium sp.]